MYMPIVFSKDIQNNVHMRMCLNGVVHHVKIRRQGSGYFAVWFIGGIKAQSTRHDRGGYAVDHYSERLISMYSDVMRPDQEGGSQLMY